MKLQRVECLTPQPPRVECYRSDVPELFVMKEWDSNLQRWHLSVSAPGRKPERTEVMAAAETLVPDVKWVTHPSVVNPFVYHLIEEK